jgi:hypothetical protein
MTIPIALTLVAVSVAAIASIMVAVLKLEVDSLKLKNDRLLQDYLNCKKALEEANTQASIDSFNAKAARAISRDACSDLVKLQAQLSTADKAYDLLVKELDTTKRKRGANGQYLKK